MSVKGKSEFLYKELSHQVLGCAFKVHSGLGPGLCEFNYETAMTVLLDKLDIFYTRQQRHDVWFEGVRVGHYVSDLIVQNKVILEFKADELIQQGHISQLFTYLRITGRRVGFVMAFGSKSLVYKRLIL